jgi:hypothetical protein
MSCCISGLHGNEGIAGKSVAACQLEVKFQKELALI